MQSFCQNILLWFGSKLRKKGKFWLLMTNWPARLEMLLWSVKIQSAKCLWVSKTSLSGSIFRLAPEMVWATSRSTPLIKPWDITRKSKPFCSIGSTQFKSETRFQLKSKVFTSPRSSLTVKKLFLPKQTSKFGTTLSGDIIFSTIWAIMLATKKLKTNL